MSTFRVYRENGVIHVNIQGKKIVTLENEDITGVNNGAVSGTIDLRSGTGAFLVNIPFADFRDKDNVALGSNLTDTKAALEGLLLVDSDLGKFVKIDVSEDLSGTTQFVHDGSVDNGGAVILDSNSAQLGFRTGTFLKLTEGVGPGGGTRKYGRMELKVDNGSGQPNNAIDIVQGDITQSPNITISGETDFVRNVTFEDDVILTAPDGTEYYLRVTNGGTLTTQAV